MRSSLLASAAVLATLTSAFAPSLADACGGDMNLLPAVFAIDTHPTFVRDAVERRAFVVIGATATTEDLTWTDLAPGTYDSSRIADVPDAAQSTTFTLVGPSGSRVVSTNRRVRLDRTFRNPEEHGALEIDLDTKSQFPIAVLGVQPTAKWLAVAHVPTTKQTLAWARILGLETKDLYVSNVQGTNIQVVSAYQPNDMGLTTFVVVNGASVGTYIGTAIGALDLGAKRYVLLETDGLITPVAV